MKLKNKNIVIAGGAGFIGSNLCRELSSENSVAAIDCLLHSNKLEPAFNVRLVKENIALAEKTEKFLKNADCVFYLASIVGAGETQKRPLETIRNEVTGLRTVLSAAERFGIPKIVYASSSAVYGKQADSTPLTETSPIFPASGYALAKLAGEQCMKIAFEENNLNTSSARLFNAYGYGQDLRGVIPRFFKQSRQNKKIAVFGTGRQTRDFVFVSDICQGLIAIAESNKTKGKTFNIATGKETAINSLAGQIIRMTGSQSAIVHKPFNTRAELETPHSVGSPLKLYRATGFKPKIGLKEGLEKIFFAEKMRKTSTHQKQTGQAERFIEKTQNRNA